MPLRGGTGPRSFTLGNRWKWVVSFTTRSLHPRRSSLRYLLDRKMCGPRSGLDAVKKGKESLHWTPVVQSLD